MMRRSLAAAVAIAITNPVTTTAQTTTCQTTRSQIVCNHSGGLTNPYGQPDYGAFMRAQQAQQAQAQAQIANLAAIRAQRDAQVEAQAERARVENADQQRQLRAQNAGKLVAAGHCEEARSYALAEGDFALANQVAQACSPVPTAPRQ